MKRRLWSFPASMVAAGVVMLVSGMAYPAQLGLPQAPWHQKSSAITIVPEDALSHQPTASTGVNGGRVLIRAAGVPWISVPLLWQTLTVAGYSNSLAQNTLNIVVPDFISVRYNELSSLSASPSNALTVTINHRVVAKLPEFTRNHVGPDLPLRTVMTVLSWAGMKMQRD